MTVVERIGWYTTLSDGGRKTPPQAADRARQPSTAGPPSLSVAHQAAILAVRLWT